MKPKYFASFDEGRGIVIGVIEERSEPVMWFQNVNEFDRFLAIMKQFRGTLPFVPDAFRRAFEED
ncbi:MAG: hypothetical protein HYX96_03765 [Chloroflexi bacterium]|nr:hypothetical protein [Chloroflexota bacterium]